MDFIINLKTCLLYFEKSFWAWSSNIAYEASRDTKIDIQVHVITEEIKIGLGEMKTLAQKSMEILLRKKMWNCLIGVQTLASQAGVAFGLLEMGENENQLLCKDVR